MVRTSRGSECHQRLIELSAELLKSQGYKVVLQGLIPEGKIDVIGIRGDKRVGIECQVRPSWKIVSAKAKKYKSLNAFLVAVPQGVSLEGAPKDVEILTMNVSRPRAKTRLVVVLQEEIEKKLREKAEGTGIGSLKRAVEEAIKEWVA
jgi:hypothetical protein